VGFQAEIPTNVLKENNSSNSCSTRAHHDEAVQQDAEPVSEHLLGDRLRASKQQLRVVAAFHVFSNEIGKQVLQNPASMLE